MVRQIYADLCGDGSHSHQEGPGQGMGCACFVHVRVIETEWVYVDHQLHPFEPVTEIRASRCQEFRMSSWEVCTPAVPEFMAVIISLYHGLKITQEEQAKWNIPHADVHIKIYSDSQNVIDYIRGPPQGHNMQVPWLAILLGMTRAILRQFTYWHLKYELKWIPREDLLMVDCNTDAIYHREHHCCSFNVHPWIEAELKEAVSQCAGIKRMLDHPRFHYTKNAIKNTNWEYIPHYSTMRVEDMIFNRNHCFHSSLNETFMNWYSRH